MKLQMEMAMELRMTMWQWAGGGGATFCCPAHNFSLLLIAVANEEAICRATLHHGGVAIVRCCKLQVASAKWHVVGGSEGLGATVGQVLGVAPPGSAVWQK